VIDGDRHDARFLDGAGRIIALKAKGRARSDLTGFTDRHVRFAVPITSWP
jgi:hypothetical protein